jgi:hypothetical protein
MGPGHAQKELFRFFRGATKLAPEVTAQESGELGVWRIRSDSRGQQLERVRYSISYHFSSAANGTERLTLRNKTTAVSEEWLLNADGTLTVETGFGLGSVPSERLVFKLAQRLPLFPEDLTEGGLLP